MANRNPEKKPTNPGAGERHEVKTLTPEQKKKQIAMMKQFGLKSKYEAKTEKAKKGKKAVEKREKKVKKGTKEYKKLLAELTDVDVDPKNDKLSKIKLAGADQLPKPPAESKVNQEKLAKAQEELRKGPKSGTKEREGLV